MSTTEIVLKYFKRVDYKDGSSKYAFICDEHNKEGMQKLDKLYKMIREKRLKNPNRLFKHASGGYFFYLSSKKGKENEKFEQNHEYKLTLEIYVYNQYLCAMIEKSEMVMDKAKKEVIEL